MTRRKPPDRYGKLRWRRGTTGYHYYEDERFGYGHVIRDQLRRTWIASTDFVGPDSLVRTLAEAKKIVERDVRKLFAKSKRIAPKKR